MMHPEQVVFEWRYQHDWGLMCRVSQCPKNINYLNLWIINWSKNTSIAVVRAQVEGKKRENTPNRDASKSDDVENAWAARVWTNTINIKQPKTICYNTVQYKLMKH